MVCDPNCHVAANSDRDDNSSNDRDDNNSDRDDSQGTGLVSMYHRIHLVSQRVGISNNSDRDDSQGTDLVSMYHRIHLVSQRVGISITTENGHTDRYLLQVVHHIRLTFRKIRENRHEFVLIRKTFL